MPAESENRVHNKITVTTDNAERAEPAEPRLSPNSAVSALVVANFATCCS